MVEKLGQIATRRLCKELFYMKRWVYHYELGGMSGVFAIAAIHPTSSSVHLCELTCSVTGAFDQYQQYEY